MQHPRVSANWLSDDMAYALAAMSPPLSTTDVVEAADKFTSDIRAATVIDYLLRQGADLLTVRQIVEALRALRDAHVTDSNLASWLLAQETLLDVDPPDLSAAAERVCQKLAPSLSRLTSTGGSQALLTRALTVARAQFPVLEGVRVGVAPNSCLDGLGDRLRDIDMVEAGRGVEAVLSVLLDLLIGFIGQDLTTHLLREIWPEMPIRSGNSYDVTANR